MSSGRKRPRDAAAEKTPRDPKKTRPLALPRRSPRRKSALTEGLYSILDVVLGRGTDRASLGAMRSTCRAIRSVLAAPRLSALRLKDGCAHVVRTLPALDRLVRVTAVLADNGHLQLDEVVADVASLTGSWDQYVVNEKNWRARWPACRGQTLELGGGAFAAARSALSTRWAGIHDIETHAGQLYVDEGAAVRFEYEIPESAASALVSVELLSSRWTLSPEMREDRDIRTLRDLDSSEAPVFRLYHADATPRGPGRAESSAAPPEARSLELLPGETTVDVHRASISAHGFRSRSPELATHDNYLDEWTLVYKVVHTLAVPRSLAGRRVLVEIDCRDHDCNAAIHNIFFNLAF